MYICYTAREKRLKAKCHTNMSNPNDETYYFHQNELNCHIKILKWLSIMGLILVTLCTPVYVLAIMEWSNNSPLDFEVKVEANQTVCPYLKQFNLKDSVILSVCHSDKEISLDIRLFLNQTDTIRGIPLNLRQ